ncbi:hypothetical protein PIB30_009653 [Stylosanthes scabra]|uniref:Uncharacterized protein n=1 Tax=Stylosanthes scabra TaxID=79078 RepID=A0ABU6T7D3_9FABA|nr:hypothetical protein [Stylosanthes scabra]
MALSAKIKPHRRLWTTGTTGTLQRRFLVKSVGHLVESETATRHSRSDMADGDTTEAAAAEEHLYCNRPGAVDGDNRNNNSVHTAGRSY